MAQVKLNVLVDKVRGKLGSVVFTVNRYANVVRQKVSPAQPETDRQVKVRSDFTAATQGWSSESAQNQAAWVTWAASHPITDVFGTPHILAPNAAYTEVNSIRKLVGLAIAHTPPASGAGAPAATVSAAAAAGAGTVTVTTQGQEAESGWYLIRSTPGMSLGANFAGSKLRIGGVVGCTEDATTAVAHPATFNPKLGFTAGRRVIVNVERIDFNGYRVGVTQYTVTASA